MVKTIRELNAYLRQRISTDADQDIVYVMDTKLAREVANLCADPQQAVGSVASGSDPAAVREIFKRTECPLRSELGKCFAERGYCAAVPGHACSVYQAVYDAGRSAGERSARIFADEKKPETF